MCIRDRAVCATVRLEAQPGLPGEGETDEQVRCSEGDPVIGRVEMSRVWQVGAYDGWEVLSALRKAIVLADVRSSLYWVHVLLTFGGRGAQKTVARQLWIAAAEIVDDDTAVIRAHAVLAHAGEVAETDHLFFLAARLCRSRKWWESAEGAEVDRLWSEAIGDLKREPREVPPYALDRHTGRGWQMFRRSGEFDDRFSGTDVGRFKTAYLFRRDGVISESSQIDAEFWPTWEERQHLQADDLPDPKPVTDDEQTRLW